MNYIVEISAYFEKLKQTIDLISKEDLNQLMNILVKAKDEGKTVFVMGNGGSAATASHYCCDFNKGISFGKEKMFKFICLNDNIPTMMAYANDISYDEIFVGPLKNFLQKGDLVIGISGSGNSNNVVKALEHANTVGAFTIGLTGYSGGKVKQICQHNVHIPVDDMQIAEDLHMVLDHCIMSILSKINI
ncbi:MAG: SIS domain-containing protein [Paludibacter sp.]|nr:SIS domain-containing protein [Paludibacter sp.]